MLLSGHYLRLHCVCFFEGGALFCSDRPAWITIVGSSATDMYTVLCSNVSAVSLLSWPRASVSDVASFAWLWLFKKTARQLDREIVPVIWLC